MSLLIELQYFPPINAYIALIKNRDINFSVYDFYCRRSFRNRCFIAGSNGLISLSIPIKGGRNQKTVFRDIRIDYTKDWQQQHWRSIFSAYGKSPWFFHYEESMEKLFSQKTDLLLDWNLLCLNWINQALGISRENLKISDESLPQLEANEIIDWRDKILPANFQDPSFGRSPVYTQVFEEKLGFQPNLSVLDFLFCCGKAQIDKLIGNQSPTEPARNDIS